jgi:CYTH domain-containing protein
MKTELEIERKFLLKSLPFVKGFDTVLDIEQFYVKGEPGFRVRKTTVRQTGKITYTHTIKKQLRPGTYEETEGEITEKEFEGFKAKAYKHIEKSRYVRKEGKLKWEIDVYQFKLIVAEVELPKEDYPLELPQFIKEVLIMEVTKFKEFTNKSLATVI